MSIELKAIKDYVERSGDLTIDEKNRDQEVVNLRVLYTALALATTNESLTTIGKQINRHHTTIIHYKRSLISEILHIYKYRLMYDRFFKESNNKRAIDVYDSLRLLFTKTYNDNKVLHKKLKEFKTNYTKNELKYRELTEEKQKIYDTRTSAILRML